MEIIFLMDFFKLYDHLNDLYPRIEPFHDTWMLWLKKKSDKELFEVIVSTILVQNTNWNNVEKALSQLKERKIFSFKDLTRIVPSDLEEIIRPAGFFKQKAKSLMSISNLMNTSNLYKITPSSRKELLKIKGIGKETADSILVYCFYRPTPIIGTYTRRFFARLFGDEIFLRMKYEALQAIIVKDFPDDYFHLGKFHALIVSHSQNFCKKIHPRCDSCKLSLLCNFGKDFIRNKNNSELQKET